MWQCYGFRVDVNASHKHNNLDLLVVSVRWACEGTAATTLTFSSILETKRKLYLHCAQVLLEWNCPGKEVNIPPTPERRKVFFRGALP